MLDHRDARHQFFSQAQRQKLSSEAIRFGWQFSLTVDHLASRGLWSLIPQLRLLLIQPTFSSYAYRLTLTTSQISLRIHQLFFQPWGHDIDHKTTCSYISKQ